MKTTDIAKVIKSATHKNKPVLIAVGGFGGSGKTTFAEKLKTLIGSAYVVNIDDFIVKEKLNEPSWNKGAFDRNRLEEEVLKPLTSGEPAAYHELIWETNSFSKLKHIPDVDYVIIEGISCYHPNIAHYYDYKIWVDTPIEIAKERGRARDGSNENAQYWDLWANNDLEYQQKYHPEKTADFTYDNSALL